jgi:hypothetical protein
LIFGTIERSGSELVIMKRRLLSDIIKHVQEIHIPLLAESSPHDDHAFFERYPYIDTHVPLFRVRKEALQRTGETND